LGTGSYFLYCRCCCSEDDDDQQNLHLQLASCVPRRRPLFSRRASPSAQMPLGREGPCLASKWPWH
jgi:hypothetical protein